MRHQLFSKPLKPKLDDVRARALRSALADRCAQKEQKATEKRLGGVLEYVWDNYIQYAPLNSHTCAVSDERKGWANVKTSSSCHTAWGARRLRPCCGHEVRWCEACNLQLTRACRRKQQGAGGCARSGVRVVAIAGRRCGGRHRMVQGCKFSLLLHIVVVELTHW